MGRRFLCLVLMLAWASVAQAQMCYLDDDGSGAAGFGQLPFDSVTDFPDPCDPGFCPVGIIEGTTNEWDCLPCGGSGGTECSTSPCDLDSGTTLGGQDICLADGTNCPAIATPWLTPTPTVSPTPTVTATPTVTTTPTPTVTVTVTPTAVTLACPTAADGSGGIYRILDTDGRVVGTPLGCLPTTTATVSPTPTLSPTPTAIFTPCGVNANGVCLGTPPLNVAVPTTVATIYATSYPTTVTTPAPVVQVEGPTFQRVVQNGGFSGLSRRSYSLYTSDSSLFGDVASDEVTITLAPSTLLAANNTFERRNAGFRATAGGGTAASYFLSYNVGFTNDGAAGSGFLRGVIFDFNSTWDDTSGVAADLLAPFVVRGVIVGAGTLSYFSSFIIEPWNVAESAGTVTNSTMLCVGCSHTNTPLTGHYGLVVTDDVSGTILNIVEGAVSFGTTTAPRGTRLLDARGIIGGTTYFTLATPTPTATSTAATPTPTITATAAATVTPAVTVTPTGATVTPTPAVMPTAQYYSKDQPISGCFSQTFTSADTLPRMHRYAIELHNIECLFSNDLGRNKMFSFEFEIAHVQVQTTDDGAVGYSWLPQGNGTRCQIVSSGVNGNERCCSRRTDVCPGSLHRNGPTLVPYGWAYRPASFTTGITGTWACTVDICPKGVPK